MTKRKFQETVDGFLTVDDMLECLITYSDEGKGDWLIEWSGDNGYLQGNFERNDIRPSNQRGTIIFNCDFGNHL